MNKMWVWLSGALLLLLCAAGCSRATYPKETLTNAVEEMCRNEYHAEVTAKVAGQTLGVYLMLDRFFDNTNGEMGFQEKATDILEDVMTSIRRVTLSTDADVKFFTLIGADESLSMELEMTRYVDDLRRVLLLDISRDDFFQRMAYKLHPSPTILGKKRVYEFFNDLGRKNVDQVIRNNFATNITVKDLSPAFFLSLLELNMKQNASYRVFELKEKPISHEKVLYYVKTRETFTPKPEFKDQSFSTPANMVNQYLLLVSCKSFPALIEKIYPLTTVNKEKQVVELPFPEEFENYAFIPNWKERDFYLEDSQLPDFIAFQIAQRIHSLVTDAKAKKLQDPYEVERVETNFVKASSGVVSEALPQRSIFEVTFTIKKKGETLPDSKIFSKPLLQLTLKTVEETCHKYQFTNFNGIRLLDSERSEILNIDKSMMGTILK